MRNLDDEFMSIEQVKQYLGQMAFVEFDEKVTRREINRRCEDCYYKEDVVKFSCEKFKATEMID